MDTTTAFKVWKTIKLGTFKTAKELREALSGVMPNDFYAWEGIESIKISPVEMEVDLVNLGVEEFELGDWPRKTRIRKILVEMGLELCPVETGPQLRLQYKEQPKNETLIVLTDNRQGPSYELVHYSSEPGLTGSDDIVVCNSGNRIIAMKPRKQETAV